MFTLPAWPLRELDAIAWSDGSPEATAVERSQFVRYSARVVEFLRFLRLPIVEGGDVKLVATRAAPEGTVAAGGRRECAVVANVGEGPLRVRLGGASDPDRDVALVLQPGEGAVLTPAAGPWSVALAGDDDFGLHLETALRDD